jgi:hypothetical protein
MTTAAPFMMNGLRSHGHRIEPTGLSPIEFGASMAANPQDQHEPGEAPPLPGDVERDRTDIRVVSLLSAVALTVAVGMWFFTKDKEMIAGDGTTVTQTTGTQSPDAQTPDAGVQIAPRPVTQGLPPAAPQQ